jgi:hypothetical protein
MDSIDNEVIDEFTVDNFESLVSCIPEDNDVEQWQDNFDILYFGDPNFNPGQVDDRWEVYGFLVKNPPKRFWDLTVLDHRITRVRSVWSIFALWLDSTPLEKRSANYLDHLEPFYSKYSCLHAKPKPYWKGWKCKGEKCQIWKEKASELQSAVVSFAEKEIPDDTALWPVEYLIETTRNQRNAYYTKRHWQSLLKMALLLNNGLRQHFIQSSFSPIYGKKHETDIRNGTNRGPKPSPKVQSSSASKVSVLQQPETLMIRLKFSTHRYEFLKILENQSQKLIRLKISQDTVRGILESRLNARLELPSLSTLGRDPPPFAVDSNASKVKSTFEGMDKVDGATLHPVSIRSNQSSSTVTLSSYPTQAKSVKGPVSGTLDVLAPPSKRRRSHLSTISASWNAPAIHRQEPWTAINKAHRRFESPPGSYPRVCEKLTVDGGQNGSNQQRAEELFKFRRRPPTESKFTIDSSFWRR